LLGQWLALLPARLRLLVLSAEPQPSVAPLSALRWVTASKLGRTR